MTLDPPGLSLRVMTADELPTFSRFLAGAFLNDLHDDELELDRRCLETGRSLAVFDRRHLVGSAAVLSRRLTVPGGPIPVAAVTAVAVAPTHRRRGLLTALMRRQIDDLHEQRLEPVAVLWASEAAIYPRFGYGPAASSHHLCIASRQTRLRPDVPRSGNLQACSREEALPAMQAVYEQVRPTRVGYLDRLDPWWEARTFDPEWRRDGASALRYVVHRDGGAEGQADGYAIFATKPSWQPSGPNGELSVREAQASTPAGYAALWAFLLEMDLVRRVRADRCAPDEPLRYLVDNPQAVTRTAMDSLWVRVVDVDRALAARTYATPVDTVLAVTDPFCPWNTGRFRLTGDQRGAQCRPTTDGAELELGAGALGAAYLGGTALTTLADAGLVTERRPGALAAASVAFRARRPPCCPEVF